tara:strand:+ start:33 stop:725 length:693 start_codon:yes stop_codon:yes gene_type:complete
MRTFYQKINQLLSKKIRKKKQINILITGGSTAKNLYKFWFINNSIFLGKKIKFFISDERITTVQGRFSNYGYIKKNLKFKNKSIKFKIYSFFKIDKNKILQIRNYDRFLPNYFDFVILSSGSDGHLASIFTNDKKTLSSKKKIEFSFSPKKPRSRVTLTPKYILKSKNIIIMFEGSEKGEIAAKSLNNYFAKKFTISFFDKYIWIFNKNAYNTFKNKIKRKKFNKKNIIF